MARRCVSLSTYAAKPPASDWIIVAQKSYESNAVSDTIMMEIVFLVVDQFNGFSGSLGPSKSTTFPRTRGSGLVAPFPPLSVCLSRDEHLTSGRCWDMVEVLDYGCEYVDGKGQSRARVSNRAKDDIETTQLEHLAD